MAHEELELLPGWYKYDLKILWKSHQQSELGWLCSGEPRDSFWTFQDPTSTKTMKSWKQSIGSPQGFVWDP